MPDAAAPTWPERPSSTDLSHIQARDIHIDQRTNYTVIHPSPSDAAMVVVGDIPSTPVGFIERPIVERVAQVLRDSSGITVCALTGMRGVGKTQIAAACARQAIAAGRGVIGWLNAETQLELSAGLDRIAERLGIADPDGNSSESALRLREHLAGRPGPALLVFDNATDPERLGHFLRSLGSTRVIITSPDRQFAEIGTPIDVDHYTRLESISYLNNRTGLTDNTGAAAVAERLGDLPLAMAAAAATIRARPDTCDYQRYLQILDAQPLCTAVPRRDGQHYPLDTETALLLAVDTVRHGTPTDFTDTVLRLIAVLSSHGVSTPLLQRLAPESPEAVNTSVEHCIRGSVLSYSVGSDLLTMHRLTARVIREQRITTPREKTAIANTALAIISPDLDDELVARTQPAVVTTAASHVEALWDTTLRQRADSDVVRAALSMRILAVHRMTNSSVDGSAAIRLGHRALLDCDKILGPDHPDSLATRSNLARAYKSARQLDKAIPLFEATLTGHERIFGTDHSNSLRIRSELASAYRSAGQLDKAIALLEGALTAIERTFGADHRDTLKVRNNLAYAYEAVGQLDKAIPLFEAAVTGSTRILGHDHPATLTTRNNLAGIYASAGRLEESIALYTSTLTDSDRVLGPDHPSILITRNNLVHAYRSAGRLDNVISVLQAALADRERILGPDHPATLATRNNLASTYRSANRLDNAITMFEATLNDCERVLGPNHPTTTAVRENLTTANQLRSPRHQ
ncbi:FxSxx-COOH system tetratricopeptide repeat protein [Nocardia pseudovaccinii]|uniref:FxSxx-COOH system tetratricopeptide repeat protein n=1 Tax=Nocardia pseudovaccinii TaxID=189540 RepID=UPI003D93634F